MKILRALPRSARSLPRLVLTIGVFDGVHRGHQAILKQVVSRARAIHGTAAVLTFEGHPTQLISPQYSPPLLTSTAQKLELLKQAGLDAVLLIKFNRAFASTTAADFVEKILAQRLRLRHLVVGYDFVFGRQGMGNLALLKEYSKKLGFGLHIQGPALLGKAPVSSTRVRSALVAGNLQEVKALLGRPYEVTGRVVHGEARGRLLGYPTANVATEQEVLPKPGVWGGKARVLNAKNKSAPVYLPFIANLGTRPTFSTAGKLGLELHLLDFKAPLYGQRLAVRFLHYLRPEKKFFGLEELKRQIQKDETAFRHWLTRNKRIA